jgi:hypothetical protein
MGSVRRRPGGRPGNASERLAARSAAGCGRCSAGTGRWDRTRSRCRRPGARLARAGSGYGADARSSLLRAGPRSVRALAGALTGWWSAAEACPSHGFDGVAVPRVPTSSADLAATAAGAPGRASPSECPTHRPGACFTLRSARWPHLPPPPAVRWGLCVDWRTPSAADVATSNPAVCLRAEPSLKLHEAPDFGAVDSDVGLDV